MSDRSTLSERLFEESGKYESGDLLVHFLYLLLRNELPAGRVAEIFNEAVGSPGTVVTFTNGHLARYAAYLASLLSGQPKVVSPAPDANPFRWEAAADDPRYVRLLDVDDLSADADGRLAFARRLEDTAADIRAAVAEGRTRRAQKKPKE